jgi:RHS repeat-associated protein
VAQQQDGVVTWLHSDHLHSATVVTDAAGADVRRLAYAAFGEETANSGSGATPQYTYTDKERDRSGLLYYGARYYDPELSRWLGCDPALEKLFHKKDVHEKISPMMLNHYSYSLNNPIRYYDPDGQEPVKAFADTTSPYLKVSKIRDYETKKTKTFHEKSYYKHFDSHRDFRRNDLYFVMDRNIS